MERDYLEEQLQVRSKEDMNKLVFLEAREKIATTWGAKDMKGKNGIILMCTICSGLDGNGAYSPDWSNSVIEPIGIGTYKLYCKIHPVFYYDIDTVQKGILILQGPKLLGHIGEDVAEALYT